RFRCVTISEFLSGATEAERLPRLHSGSWINHNFKVWIGHAEDNAAWEQIFEAREALTAYQESAPEAAEGEERLR
ncbi:MAG: hypothetical protein GWO24_00220, partial [Akkermansiaceae bacterium]|nr:hypothetical protein [Akkermansiaceae bacterium]NIT76538.1 hypothetical protein [Thermoplasmata archaeon]NIY02909.1 hypothetical protein [Thermoplasmata archaeon]